MNRKLKDRPTEEPEESDEEELLKEYEWAKEHIPDEVSEVDSFKRFLLPEVINVVLAHLGGPDRL